MKRIIIALVGVAIAASTLTGCAGGQAPAKDESGGKVAPSSTIGGTVRTGYVELPDGREVLCVTNQSGNSGGISCDWDTASKE